MVRPALVLMALALLLAGCGGGRKADGPPGGGVYKLGQPYEINGRWYHPYFDPDYRAEGVASWYGAAFHGRPTANGERFDKNRISAAHPTLPLPSLVRVTNLENGRALTLRVNDRGPFVGDRLIDLSQAAARELGFERRGLARVRVEFVALADAAGTPPLPTGPRPAAQEVQLARAAPPAAVPAPLPPPVRIAAAPAPAAPACVVASEVPASAFIQVAALSQPERVQALARQLQPHLPVQIQPTMVGGQAVARVQVGPVHGADEVGRTLARLHGMGHPDAYVVAADGGGRASVIC